MHRNRSIGKLPELVTESNSWRNRTLVLAVCAVVAAFVYGMVLGLIYPEFTDFALTFGRHSWYKALGFGDILSKYFTLGVFDWYRPTSFYLVPYLARVDYFRPASVTGMNIAFFILTAVSITLFLRRARLLPSLAGALVVLLAPALYLVTYGAQIDSLYVLFSLLFLLVAIKLQYGASSGRTRVLLRVVLVLLFGLAITSKEVAIFLPFLLVPTLLMMGPELSLEQLKRTVRLAAPFMLVAIAFAVTFSLFRKPGVGGARATQFEFGKLDTTVDMLSWTLGFRSPRDSEFANWIPPWGNAELLVAIVLIAVAVGALALTWRRFGLWRIGIYAGTFVALAAAIALPGGLPHQTFPLVVMYGLGLMVVLNALYERLNMNVLRVSVSLALLVMVGLQVVVARHTYGNVLARGPHSAYLEASTELFYQPEFGQVRNTRNPLLIFEDCLGGLHNPLRFFARAASGSEIVVRDFEVARPRLTPQIRAAVKERRQVFVARCTRKPPPWYRVYRYRLRGHDT